MKLFISVLFVCLFLTAKAEIVYFKNEIKLMDIFPFLYVVSLPAFLPSP